MKKQLALSMHRQGFAQKEIAEELGVSKQSVSRYLQKTNHIGTGRPRNNVGVCEVCEETKKLDRFQGKDICYECLNDYDTDLSVEQFGGWRSTSLNTF